MEKMSDNDSDWKEAEQYISKHLPGYLDVIKDCEEEIEVGCLEFPSFGFSGHLLRQVVDFLCNSRTAEFTIDGDDLAHAVASVAEKLSQTKLKKLNVSACKLMNSDISCLVRVLKDTVIINVEFWDLQVEFTEEEAEEFVAYLCMSRLTHLAIQACSFFVNAGAACFVHSLPATTVTHLDLHNSLHDKVALVSLFAILPKTLITDLDLTCNKITNVEMEVLKQTLRESKLERLNLAANEIGDVGVDILAKALVSSNVTDLSLRGNKISGKNNLGLYLKDTKINILDLSRNIVEHSEMFSFPDFVKGTSICTLILEFCHLNDQIGINLMRSLNSSKVVKLNLEGNNFGLETVSEFAKFVKYTNVTEVNFSRNPIPYEGFSFLAQCLKSSKVRSVKLENIGNLSRIFGEMNDSSTFIGTFVEKSKGSKISSVNFGRSFINSNSTEIAKCLANTTFTHLDLRYCSIGDAVMINLAASMKFTCITHLKLSGNKIGDEGAEALAVCLPETQINTLDLSSNNITACRALHLASCLNHTSLYVLDLSGNKIDDEGFEDLVKIIKGTFVTEFEAGNHSDRLLFIIDSVLLKNRVSVHKMLEFVKKIAPKTPNDSFCFDCKENANIIEFLDECLHFSKVIEQASAINAITHAGILSLPRKQVAKLFLEEFPRQLALSVGTRVETDIEQHVRFVEKADDMQLTKVVDFLLLNRPNLMIDRDEGILHPRIYPLVVKYKQPIFNLNIEPQGRVKIIKYFTENIRSETKVIEILSDESVN